LFCVHIILHTFVVSEIYANLKGKTSPTSDDVWRIFGLLRKRKGSEVKCKYVTLSGYSFAVSVCVS